MLMEYVQEGPEIVAPLVTACQQQTVSRTDVARTKHDAPGVAAAQRHRGRLATLGPAGAQRREQQQVGLVFEQQRGTWTQLLDSLTDPAYLLSALRIGKQHVTGPL